MPKWTKPSEGLPECEAGDRVLLIVNERTNRQSIRKTRRLVIIEATETGWMESFLSQVCRYPYFAHRN